MFDPTNDPCQSEKCKTHHEGIRSLIPKFRPLRQVVEDTGFVDVVQRCHVADHLRIRGVRLSKSLRSTRAGDESDLCM